MMLSMNGPTIESPRVNNLEIVLLNTLLDSGCVKPERLVMSVARIERPSKFSASRTIAKKSEGTANFLVEVTEKVDD
jgi:hypothetical protein